MRACAARQVLSRQPTMSVVLLHSSMFRWAKQRLKSSVDPVASTLALCVVQSLSASLLSPSSLDVQAAAGIILLARCLVTWLSGVEGIEGMAASQLPTLLLHHPPDLSLMLSSLARRVSRPFLHAITHPPRTTDTTPWARTRESPTNGAMPMPPGPMSVSSSRPQVSPPLK